MSFQTGDAVYVMPTIDTGEIRASHPPVDHDVFCDSDAALARHPEASLRALPYKGRQEQNGFLIITRARVTRTGRRKLDISHHVIMKDGVITSRKFREIRISP